MKSFLFAVGAALILSVSISQTSVAQHAEKSANPKEEQKQKSPAEVASKRSAMLQEKLGLTNDQTSKIKNILYENLNGKENATEAEKKEIHKKINDEIMKVLTPDQQKKYIDLKEEQKKKKMEEGNKDHGKNEKASQPKSK